jgi:hypothetical protein
VFRDKLVLKPWGSEYLAFESPDVALWVLKINRGFSTSMHAHPGKTTGLVLLNGSIELSFIADSKTLNAPEKQMIRRGLFHKSTALTDDVVLLEIETPNDKGDLVRLTDEYGRDALGYEGKKDYVARTSGEVWIETPADQIPVEVKGLSSNIHVQRMEKISDFDNFDDACIVMFLSGGIGKTVDGRNHLATCPGDVAFFKILKVVLASMEYVEKGTTVLRIN